MSELSSGTKGAIAELRVALQLTAYTAHRGEYGAIILGMTHPGITGRLHVDGGIAGAIIAVGFMVMGWIGIPQARPFLLGAFVFGIILGFIRYWRYR
jgi:hypothetical protein